MKTFRREACGIYILAILFAIPLIYNLKYEDIIFVKSNLFFLLTYLFYVCVIISTIGKCVSDKKMGIDIPGPKEIIKGFDPLDWSLIAMCIIIIISSVTSRFPFKDTMYAVRSQLVGCILMTFLIINFFIISRCAEAAKKSYVVAFYASSLAVETLGILNKIRIDPLEMHKDNVLDTFTFMTSTIGNVDYFYAYTSLIIMFFAAYRADMKFDVWGVLVDVLLVIGYMNFWSTRAGGILAAFSYGLLALVFISMTSFKRFKNLFWQGFLAGVAGLLCEILSKKYDIYWATDFIVMKMVNFKLWLIMGIVCIIIWFILGNVTKNKKEEEISKALSGLKIPVIALSCFIMVMFEGLILFNRKMQDLTGRTYIWDDLKKAYAMGSFREKLIGVGPGNIDNALISLGLHTPEESYFLTAHNEVIEYWFLYGIIGAVIYVIFMAAFFFNFYRNVLAADLNEPAHLRDMLCCGVLFATYLGQGLTNGPYNVNIIIGFTILALFRRFQIPDPD